MNHVTSLAVIITSLGLSCGMIQGQERELAVELRGGIALPVQHTDRDVGPLVGGGVWYSPAGRSWQVGVEADHGFHGPSEGASHLMAKVGYTVLRESENRLQVSLNLGLGWIRIGHHGSGPVKTVFGYIPPFPAYTSNHYGANGGIRTLVHMTPRLDLILGFQADVAFSDYRNYWIWPLAAGIHVGL